MMMILRMRMKTLRMTSSRKRMRSPRISNPVITEYQ